VRWVSSSVALDLTAGYRRLEGIDLAGIDTSDDGFFADLEASRWWSEASIRTAVRAGIDHLNVSGTEPTIGLSIEKLGSSGSSLSLRYDHSPAYLLAATLESAVAEVTADKVEVVGSKPLGDMWGLTASADVALFDGGGLTNTRLGGSVTISRQLGSLFRTEFSSRLVGFSDASPVIGRRLYWDPNLFWSNSVGLSLSRIPELGWGYRARILGGAAWSDERDVLETQWVPQLGVDAGLRYLTERTTLDLGAYYRRSREDEYSAFGVDLTLRVRP